MCSSPPSGWLQPDLPAGGVHTDDRNCTSVSDQPSAWGLVIHAHAMVCSQNATPNRTTVLVNWLLSQKKRRVPEGSPGAGGEGKQRLCKKRTERREGDPMQTDTGRSGSPCGKERGDPDHWSSFTKREPSERRLSEKFSLDLYILPARRRWNSLCLHFVLLWR